MENYHSGKTIQDLIVHARFRQRRSSPVFQDLYAVRAELRERRKQLLGSYISLERLDGCGASLDENAIEVLSEYLASRTLWNCLQIPLTSSKKVAFSTRSLLSLPTGAG